MAKRSKKEIAEEKAAAARAAEEAVEEMETDFESPEQRDISFALGQEISLSDREVDERDVFPEGRAVGTSRNKTITFRIYIDNEWVATKPTNYSWEKLRKDFPRGGSVKVVAVDRDNKYAASQTLQVAADEEAIEQRNSNGFHNPGQQQSSLEMLELMKENQREAEAKSQSQQTGLASVMASVVQMQTQSTQMMMQMFQKSSEQTQNLMIAMMNKNQEPKGPDPILTLLTTLLTQKPQDTGPKAMELIKMLEDAKRDAKREAREDIKIRDDQARKLAEDMTPENTGEESLTKTIIKAMAPVIADIAAKNQQGQLEVQRRQAGNAGLNQGFVEGRELRPAIPASNPQRRPVQRPAQPPAGASVSAEPMKSGVVSTGVAVPGAIMRTAQEKGPVEAPVAQENVVDGRLQVTIFNFCSADIAEALLNGHLASKTAEACLARLEKEGISRQTVAKAFTLEDFYRIGEQAGVPDVAKPWLKEFHESIAFEAGKESVRAAPDTGVAVRVNGSGEHIGTNGKGPVAPSGSKTPRSAARTQSRERAKDL